MCGASRNDTRAYRLARRSAAPRVREAAVRPVARGQAGVRRRRGGPVRFGPAVGVLARPDAAADAGNMIVAFSVSPSGRPSDPGVARDAQPDPDGASVHDAVAAAVQVVRDSGLPNRTSSMFTSIVDLGHGSFIRPAGI